VSALLDEQYCRNLTWLVKLLSSSRPGQMWPPPPKGLIHVSLVSCVSCVSCTSLLNKASLLALETP
jgi:hypothetical protein